MEKVSNIVRQFIDDPAGNYKYLGELEAGKHFVEYMFTDDCMDGDVALCVGGSQYLIVTDEGQCRYTDNDEYELILRYLAVSLEYEDEV